MKTIATVLGARPQFIKAATITRAIRQTEGLREVLIHTGQHYDDNMSTVFFTDLMGQAPDHNLHISGGTHGAMTGRMLEAVEGVLSQVRPDMVLVYGDTNSTLAGALCAAKMHIPVAHVEAGLRSFNMKMPEEINRRLTDHCSDLLFTPTDTADRNLANEGIESGKVHRVGDVMYDASVHFGKQAAEKGELLASLGLKDRDYILATVHRQENTDHPDRLGSILDALAAIAKEIPVLLPLHPRTRAKISATGLDQLLSKLTCVEPLGYLQMVEAERSAVVIATDSGGVQKEAFFHKVPCVTLRDETEWVELLDSGWNRLVSPAQGSKAIQNAILSARGVAGAAVEPYGLGDASDRIAQVIRAYLA
ncbi:non-hydrolyzing UDP-N-acetylglucosamine 2-epimerase [Pseudooceanicola onchidii]|uniref:non-hydrolyzing UDP-N-acetylglucosamine 2-epimerase n=1 Tax=Pseudooceanicola onchidii TaxID=2562279 RepID=UPI0010A9C294|nr:UDP-N-acetylglucosamine 2-epimerase (non-hydrolyzing) [Pseudooceanicola onchidii]